MTAGFPTGYRLGGAIDPAVIEHWSGRIPRQIEEVWRSSGAMMSEDGYIRLLNPGLLLPVMDQLLPSYPGALPVFATAWGDLVVWHEGAFVCVLFRYGCCTVYSEHANGLIFAELEDEEIQAKMFPRKDYDEAMVRKGVPNIDQCFGLQTPVAAGGLETFVNVERRNLREYLLFLVGVQGVPRLLDEMAPAPIPLLGDRARVPGRQQYQRGRREPSPLEQQLERELEIAALLQTGRQKVPLRPETDEAIIRLAAHGRFIVYPPHEALLRVGDAELMYRIIRISDEYVLEKSERGGASVVVMTSTFVGAARRSLISVLAARAGMRLPIPPTAHSGDPDDLPEGFELTESDGRALLRWEGYIARFRGTSRIREAIQLAHLLTVSETALLDACLRERDA